MQSNDRVEWVGIMLEVKRIEEIERLRMGITLPPWEDDSSGNVFSRLRQGYHHSSCRAGRMGCQVWAIPKERMIMLDGLELVGGLPKFPRDVDIRREIWSEEVFKHPAKYNLHMVWRLVKYCTTEGQTILDPMSGTGSSMVAAIEGRNVILIEIEEKYHEMQQKAAANMTAMGGVSGEIMLLLGDCRKFLPMPGVDFIMFSPPYADMIKRKKVSGIAAEGGSSFSELPDYSKDPWNIGKQNYFMYHQIMERVYRDLLDTAPLMAIVVKDRYRDQLRVQFVEDNIKVCEKVGWTVKERIKFKPQGTEFIAIQKSMGFKAVEDESIIILRR